MGLGESKESLLYRITNPRKYRNLAYVLKVVKGEITDMLYGIPSFRTDGSVNIVSDKAIAKLAAGEYEWYSDNPTFKGQEPTLNIIYTKVLASDLKKGDIVYLPLLWDTNHPFTFYFASVNADCNPKRGILSCGLSNEALSESKYKKTLKGIALEPGRDVELVTIELLE